MILKQFRNMLFIVSIAAFVLSCSWTTNLNPIIHPNRLIDTGTKVEIVNVSKDILFNSTAASDQDTIDTMIRRITELTCDELASMDIEAYTIPTPGAAKLKYEIKTVNTELILTDSIFGINSDDKFEVSYRVIFENPKGEIIFVDTTKKDDSDIDDLFENIASRTARNVANCYKRD
ncbi:MAG TPA: hypothetical protein VK187_12085 [Geobacteraceae bacterium]|nr:hypothetical protein [Geobacteraceae bacterium]